MTERLHSHFSLSCIGEGNGNSLQCSCLENPRDSRAWWAAVYGVAQSRTRLKRLSSSSPHYTVNEAHFSFADLSLFTRFSAERPWSCHCSSLLLPWEDRLWSEPTQENQSREVERRRSQWHGFILYIKLCLKSALKWHFFPVTKSNKLSPTKIVLTYTHLLIIFLTSLSFQI